jgi:hypothetical protein
LRKQNVKIEFGSEKEGKCEISSALKYHKIKYRKGNDFLE